MFKNEESISKALNKNSQKLDNNILGIQKANQIVRWKSGFLLKAITKGNCAILDSIYFISCIWKKYYKCY